MPKVIQLFSDEDSGANRTYGKENGSCNCIIICNGKRITTICNPGSSKYEKITEFEYSEKIDSIESYDNYIIVNNCEVIMIEGEYSSDLKLIHIENIKNMQQVQVEYLSSDDFIKNDNGCFCIAGLSEQERLQLYKEHGFTDLYEQLSEEIANKEKEEQEKAQKRLENNRELIEYVESAKSLLVPVVYRNPGSEDIDLLDDSEIYSASEHKKIGAIYYGDNPDVQALYGIQEKGWSGQAYRGMIINVKLARKIVKPGGKLHLDVPEEAMGQIIGSKGSNINFTTEKLREKGVDVSRIILHPKTKEEMKIKLDNIENAIKSQKSQSHDEQ